jgi:hypothetical protein
MLNVEVEGAVWKKKHKVLQFECTWLAWVESEIHCTDSEVIHTPVWPLRPIASPHSLLFENPLPSHYYILAWHGHLLFWLQLVMNSYKKNVLAKQIDFVQTARLVGIDISEIVV